MKHKNTLNVKWGGLILASLFLIIGNSSSVRGATTIPITVDSGIQHGTVQLSATSGTEGQTITVTPKPAPGYQLKVGSLKYSGDGGSTWNSIVNNNLIIPDGVTTSKSYAVSKTNNDVDSYVTDSYGCSKDDPCSKKTLYFTDFIAVKPGTTIQLTFKAKNGWKNRIRLQLYDMFKSSVKTLAYASDSQGGSFASGFESTTFVIPENIYYVKASQYTFYNVDSGFGENKTENYDIEITSISLPLEISIVAEFEPINVNYQVNHYIENLDGSYSLYTSETKSGLTDSKITISQFIKSLTGFSFNKATN